MLIKKETFQHLKWNVQINVVVNRNVYIWAVTLKSVLSYTKNLIWINPHLPLRTNLRLHSASVLLCLHRASSQRAPGHPCAQLWQRSTRRDPSLPGVDSGRADPRHFVFSLAPPSRPRGDSPVPYVWRAPSLPTGLVPPGQLQGKLAFPPLTCRLFWGKLDGSSK